MAKHVKVPNDTKSASAMQRLSLRAVFSEDPLVFVVGVALSLAMCFALLYGFAYGNVDTSVAVGKVKVEEQGKRLFTIKTDENLHARVDYSGTKMRGNLVVDGADKETILFQLKEITYDDGTDAAGAAVYIRMPRSGVQGDFAGHWSIYYLHPSAEKSESYWLFANGDGTAVRGYATGYNAIINQRASLIEDADSAWTWEKDGSALKLRSNGASKENASS